MTATRQLLRFSIPGGLLLLLVAAFQAGIKWAFGLPEPTPVFTAIGANIIAVLGTVLVVGFILFQLYYLYHRPRRPRYFLGRRRTDFGGLILQSLEGKPLDPKVLCDIRAVYDADLNFDTEKMSDKDYNSAWHEHDSVVRSLLAMIASEGGEELKADYVALFDTYHLLGVCRYVPFVAVIAVAGQVRVNYWHHVVGKAGRWVVERTCVPAQHLPAHAASARWDAKHMCLHQSMWHYLRPVQAYLVRISVLAALALGVVALIAYTCHHNRVDCWKAMVNQLRRNLRAWFLRHPDFVWPKEKSAFQLEITETSSITDGG